MSYVGHGIIVVNTGIMSIVAAITVGRRLARSVIMVNTGSRAALLAAIVGLALPAFANGHCAHSWQYVVNNGLRIITTTLRTCYTYDETTTINKPRHTTMVPITISLSSMSL